MPFIDDDDIELPAAKVDVNVRPASIPATKWYSGQDWNSFRTAHIDTKAHIRNSGLRISVKSEGAVGDGVTDDRAAIHAALAKAKELGAGLHFPWSANPYKVSKYIDLSDCIGLSITFDPGARILWPSDDDTIPLDGVAVSDEMARACFVGAYVTDLSIHGGRFIGGNHPNHGKNQGSVVYLTHAVGTFVGDGVTAEGGYSICAQDNQPRTTGTGASITVNGSTVTINSVLPIFRAGHAARRVTLSGCTNRQNDRSLPVKSFVSTSSITVEASDMVAEVSGFTITLDDNDRGTILDGFHSLNQRGFLRTSSHSIITNFIIERPLYTLDTCGRAHKFSITGSTVTLTSPAKRFTPHMVGKIIAPAGSTSAGNDGFFPILTVSADGKSVTYTNASGVTEIAPTAGTWWVANGDRAGLGNGVGAITKNVNTITFTANTNAFTTAMIGQPFRIAKNGTAGNNGCWPITAVPAPNQVQFTNASGANADHAGPWSIDTFDATTDGTNTVGSTHGGYIYADREDVHFSDGVVLGVRKDGIKGSGSSSPQRNVTGDNITFVECGEAILIGADDSQEHTGHSFTNITAVDCGTNRAGASESHCFSFLGSRGATLRGVKAYFTRNAIGSVDGRGVSGNNFITASRALPGISQPIEDLTIDDVEVFIDPQQCTDGSLFSIGLNIAEVGLLGYHRNPSGNALTKHTTGNITMGVVASTGVFTRSSGSFITDGFFVGGPFITAGYVNGGNNATKTIQSMTALTVTVTSNAGLVDEAGTGNETASNGVMTLTDASAKFPQSLVGGLIGTFGCGNAANDIADASAKVIESVAANGQSLTYTLTTGVGTDTCGTYRIFPRAGMKSNQCRVSRCYLNTVGAIAAQFTSCVMPVVDDLRWANGTVAFAGDRMPILKGLVETATNTQTARIRFATGTSWPVLFPHNMPAHELGISSPHGLSVGLSGTILDYPLLGTRGRCLPTQAMAQVVVAYGSKHVNGDTIVVAGTTYTYKSSSPTGNQFNSMAGLIALIDAQAGLNCIEYGSNLSPAAACGHMLISTNAAGTADGTIIVTTSTLFPTALVTLRNGSGANSQSLSRGAGRAGPTADKFVVWSPLCSYEAGAILYPGNAAAQTLFQTYGWRPVKNSDDAGACEVFTIENGGAGTTGGTEEARWRL